MNCLTLLYLAYRQVRSRHSVHDRNAKRSESLLDARNALFTDETGQLRKAILFQQVLERRGRSVQESRCDSQKSFLVVFGEIGAPGICLVLTHTAIALKPGQRLLRSPEVRETRRVNMLLGPIKAVHVV